MKYCLTWFCGDKFWDGFYIYHCKSRPESGQSLLKTVKYNEHDVLVPFISSKEDCEKELLSAPEYISWGEKTEWKVTPVILGKCYELYNRLFNSWLDFKLFGPFSRPHKKHKK